jgi:hypothetical protein
MEFRAILVNTFGNYQKLVESKMAVLGTAKESGISEEELEPDARLIQRRRDGINALRRGLQALSVAISNMEVIMRR